MTGESGSILSGLVRIEHYGLTGKHVEGSLTFFHEKDEHGTIKPKIAALFRLPPRYNRRPHMSGVGQKELIGKKIEGLP